jgi:hypothetical protein
MELTPGQQRLVFVVVVLALAGLGIYLLNGRESGGSPAAAPSTTPASTAAAPPTASSAASAPGTSVPPTAAPSATSAATAGGTDIYQLLPFTQAGLSAAVNTTTAFAKAYATWSYTESATAYGATFNGLATTKEIGILESNYNSAAAQQTAKKLVSTGTGTIDSISSIIAVPGQPMSLTFTVTINQQVTPAQPGAAAPSQYAVTLSPQGTAWLVSDIELSKLGNS